MSFFMQAEEYTKEVCDRLNIAFDAGGKKNYRNWDNGQGPTGFCMHFTASNSAITESKSLGRLPNLLRRFAKNSSSPGVHFISMDGFFPEFEDIRKNYDIFKQLECDIFHFGMDVAFYHCNQANGICFGVENRNIGKLKKKDGWRVLFRELFIMVILNTLIF